MGVRSLLEVAWRGVHRHGRLKHRGSVILVRNGISSFYRLSQKYQTNRNNKWSLYAVMMVQVRVGDEGSGRRRLGPYEFSNTAVATNSHHVSITKSGDLSALYSWISHTVHPLTYPPSQTPRASRSR